MYSRYLPPDDAFLPLPPEEEPSAPQPAPKAPAAASARPPQNRTGPRRSGPTGDLLSGATQEITKLLSEVLGKFSLEDLDSGDILLILIVLFLFLEGDDLDLAIALGLALLLSLGEAKDPGGHTPPPDAAPSHPAG